MAMEEDSLWSRLRPRRARQTDWRRKGRLTGIEGEREFAEQGLPGVTRGEMNPDAARRLTNASSDFEEPGAQSFDLYRAPRFRQLQKTKLIDQVVGEGMQQQAEGIGQKAVTAQAVGAETVL